MVAQRWEGDAAEEAVLTGCVAAWERLQERFFGYHRDLPPELVARMLGGRIVYEQQRREQWLAVIAMDTVENAALSGRPTPVH